MSKREEFEAGGSHPPLSDHEKQILDFARQDFPSAGHRMMSILKTFGMSETSFFSRLNTLRSHPEAVSYAPDVIRRANQTIQDRDTRLGRG